MSTPPPGQYPPPPGQIPPPPGQYPNPPAGQYPGAAGQYPAPQYPAPQYPAPGGGYAQPGAPYPPPPPPGPYPPTDYFRPDLMGPPPGHLVRVPNYLWQSITLTVLASISCLIPLALSIPALLNSLKVDNLVRMGDLDGAHDASRKAKWFCVWALLLFVVPIVLLITLGATGALDE